MRMMLTVVLAILLSAGQLMAKDDGGFGSSRFSKQTPLALGENNTEFGTTNVIAVNPPSTPADIEPASGEEDITPEQETLVNGQVIQNSEQEDEPFIIKKDLSVR